MSKFDGHKWAAQVSSTNNISSQNMQIDKFIMWQNLSNSNEKKSDEFCFWYIPNQKKSEMKALNPHNSNPADYAIKYLLVAFSHSARGCICAVH